MAKLAIIATLKTTPGRRDDYLPHLKAHGQRCLANEPGTLKFEILVPNDQPDTILLYEVYANAAAFEAHWNGESIIKTRADTQGMVAGLTGVRCTPLE